MVVLLLAYSIMSPHSSSSRARSTGPSKVVPQIENSDILLGQHPNDRHVFGYVGALALLEQYHRPLMHVGSRVFLEGGGA